MSLFKKLLSDTVLYGLSSILGRTLNYFLVIVHTAVFSSGDFGIQSELYIYVAFLQIIYLYGMETAFFRYSQQYGVLRVYRLLMSSILVSTTIFTIILWYFSNNIATLLGYEGKGYLIRMLACILATDALLALPFAKLRQENKAHTFAFTKIVNILLLIGFNLFFFVLCRGITEGHFLASWRTFITLIYQPEWGIYYIFLANLLANLLQIPLLYKPLLAFRFQWHFTQLKLVWWYAYPLIFTGLAGMVNTMIDRIMLKYYLPPDFYAGRTSIEAVGIYAACLKLAIFMSLVVQAFRYAAEPFFFSQAQDKNSPMLFARIMRYFIVACCLIYVAVSLNTDILGYIFLRKPEYREGLGVVPWLLLANLFVGIYFNLSTWFKLTDKTYFGTYFSFAGALLTIVLNLALIPLLGYLGSAISFLATTIFMVVLAYIYGQKYYPIPYQITHATGHIMVATFCILVGNLAVSNQFWLNFSWHQGLLLAYVGYIFYTERSQLGVIKKTNS